VNIEERRREAAELIRAAHRRPGDSVGPVRVTISEATSQFDLVRVEYTDGTVREFMRTRPDEAEPESPS
jgi:hypothetical protein